MLKQEILDAINKQISREMYSSNLYLAMVAYFSSLNLPGFASWMRLQAEDETEHAMRFFDYVIERGNQPLIRAMDAPPEVWDSPLAAFEASYKHEQFITQCIYDLVELAGKNADHATSLMLQWYVKEQVEEESTVNEIIYRLKMMGDFSGGLVLLDSELRKRVMLEAKK